MTAWPFCEPVGLTCAGDVCGEQGEKFPLAPPFEFGIRKSLALRGDPQAIVFRGQIPPAFQK